MRGVISANEPCPAGNTIGGCAGDFGRPAWRSAAAVLFTNDGFRYVSRYLKHGLAGLRVIRRTMADETEEIH